MPKKTSIYVLTPKDVIDIVVKQMSLDKNMIESSKFILGQDKHDMSRSTEGIQINGLEITLKQEYEELP